MLHLYESYDDNSIASLPHLFEGCANNFMHSVATGYACGVIATDCPAHLHLGKAQGDENAPIPDLA